MTICNNNKKTFVLLGLITEFEQSIEQSKAARTKKVAPAVKKPVQSDEKKQITGKAVKKDDEDTNDSMNSDDTIENVDLNESQSDDRSLKEIQNEERDECVEEKKDEQRKDDRPKEQQLKDRKETGVEDGRKDEIENNLENAAARERTFDLDKKEPKKADKESDKNEDDKSLNDKPLIKPPCPVQSNTVKSVSQLFKVDCSDKAINKETNKDVKPDGRQESKDQRDTKDKQPETKQPPVNIKTTIASVQIMITKPANLMNSLSTTTSTQNKTTAFFPIASSNLSKVCLPQVKPINVNQKTSLNDTSTKHLTTQSINQLTSLTSLSNSASTGNLKEKSSIRNPTTTTKPSSVTISSTTTVKPTVKTDTLTNRTAAASSMQSKMTMANGLANLPKPIPINSAKLLQNNSLPTNLLTINNLTPFTSSPLTSNLSAFNISSTSLSNLSNNNLLVSNSLTTNNLTTNLTNSSTNNQTANKIVKTINVSKTFTPIVSPVVNLNQFSPNLIKNNLTNLSSTSIEKIKVPSFIKSAPPTKSTNTVSSISALMNKQMKKDVEQTKKPTTGVQQVNGTNNGEPAKVNGQLTNFKQTSDAILQVKQRNVRRISPPPIFWQKHNHLIDQVVVTDVKSEDVSITIRESKTPLDFFKNKNPIKKKKNLNKSKQKNSSICSNGSQ